MEEKDLSTVLIKNPSENYINKEIDSDPEKSIVSDVTKPYDSNPLKDNDSDKSNDSHFVKDNDQDPTVTKGYDSDLESHIMSSNKNLVKDNGTVYINDNNADDNDSDLESHIVIGHNKNLVKDNGTVHINDNNADDNDSDLESHIVNGLNKNLIKNKGTDQKKDYEKSAVKDHDSDLKSQIISNNVKDFVKKDDTDLMHDNDKSFVKNDLENILEKVDTNVLNEDDNHIIVKDEHCTLVKEETHGEGESDTSPVVDSDVLFEPKEDSDVLFDPCEYNDGVDGHSSLDDDEDVKIEHTTKVKLNKLLKERVHQRKDELENRKKYICNIDGCNKKFPRPSRLAVHQRTHTGERPFVCKDCDKSYVRKQHLQAHAARNHQNKPAQSFTCDVCDKGFASKDNVNKHKKRAHDDSRFKCNDCDAAFPKRQDRKKHISEMHGTMANGVHSCYICHKEFVTEESLTKHISGHKEHTCAAASCGQTFLHWSQFQQHRKIHKQDGEQVMCPTCGKKISKRGFEAHKKTHDEERPVIHCPVEECKRFFFYYKNMKQHFSTFHNKKKHPCTYSGCESKLATEQKLAQHIATIHHKDPLKIEKKPKKQPCQRKDKGKFKKPLAAIITRMEVTDSQALLKQKQKLPLESLEKIRSEALVFVGSSAETSDSDGPFVGCKRSMVNMSEIKKTSYKKKRKSVENEISAKVAEVLEGKESIKSFFFNDMSSDTDTDLDLGSGGHLDLGSGGHPYINGGYSSNINIKTNKEESPKKPFNLSEFIVKKTS